MRLTALFALSLAALASPLAAQTLDRLRESGELRIGYRTDAAPLSYADEAGLPAGYSVQVCEAVAADLAGQLDLDALTTVPVAIDIEDRFTAVAEGRIDLLCGAASITLTRRETVDFSIPVFVDGTSVMIGPDTSEEITGLAGERIGVRAGTTTETSLRNSLEALEMEAEVVAVDSHEAGLAAIETGDIAAYFADQSILHELVRTSEQADTLRISNEILTVEKQALALPRGDADFRLAVDRALSRLYADGSMGRFFADAFGGATPGLALEALFLLAPELP